MSIAATYVQATPDLMMGDLLKTMRSSQIFSVCGLPEVTLRKMKAKGNGATQYQAELAGLDVFDPVEMRAHHEPGDNVPAWLLDTDYQRALLPSVAGVFPAHERMGQPKEGSARHLRRIGLGSSGRHSQRTVRSGRARPNRR